MLYPQNGDRIVTIDSVTLFHPMYKDSVVEVCMGMGKTGIPWVPWDSYGNGSKISHGMGIGWE